MLLIEILKAILFGIVEGITEWLPVSSTGHIILLDEFLSLNVAPELGEVFRSEFGSMFEVVIQLGAIMAVVVLFWGKINPFLGGKGTVQRKNSFDLWKKIIIASIPAALVGVVGDKLLEKASGKDIDGWIFNWQVVSVALIVYGVAFIIIEKALDGKPSRVNSVDELTYRDAMLVGCFQTLSIVPGTSRSGSTILGARCMGVSREPAAEFSFMLGIPAMLGASAIKGLGFFKFVLENGISVPASAWIVLAVASIVAFAVSMAVIKFLMDFVKRHSFIPFGIYRIALGAIVILYFVLKV